jgi:hypothetical protein
MAKLQIFICVCACTCMRAWWGMDVRAHPFSTSRAVSFKFVVKSIPLVVIVFLSFFYDSIRSVNMPVSFWFLTKNAAASRFSSLYLVHPRYLWKTLVQICV